MNCFIHLIKKWHTHGNDHAEVERGDELLEEGGLLLSVGGRRLAQRLGNLLAHLHNFPKRYIFVFLNKTCLLLVRNLGRRWRR